MIKYLVVLLVLVCGCNKKPIPNDWVNPQDMVVKVFRYTNIKIMTDENPNVMANGEQVFSGALAVSRDLLDYVQFGDCVALEINNEFKYFVVCDTMNIRHKKSVDIFVSVKNTKHITKEEWKILNRSDNGRLWVKVNPPK